MMELFTDFRKTALTAGIAITVSALWSFFRQLLTSPHNTTADFVTILAFSLISLLIEVPLPVLLVLLYRTGIRPALSRNLRFLAATLAVIRGATVLFDIRDLWHAAILSATRHAVFSPGTQSWFFLPPDSHWRNATLVISNVVNCGSALAFVFFLVALARQRGPLQQPDKHASRQVRNAALIAIFARALDIIMLWIAFQAYTQAVRTYGPTGMAASRVLPEIRDLLFAIPGLIAPWIILVTVNRNSRITIAGNSIQ